MKLEDLMATLREGRRLRRPGWQDGRYIHVNEIAGLRSDSITKVDGASRYTWPSNQQDSHDILADDWQIMPGQVFGDDVPGNYQDAMDLVLTRIRDGFDPYSLVKDAGRPTRDGIAGLKGDSDWRNRCHEAMKMFMQAAAAKEVESQRYLLVSACCEALKAVALHLAEEYVLDVMRR